MREGIAMIKVDLSGAAGFFDPAGPDYAAAARAHRALLEHSGAGAEFTGWLDLPGSSYVYRESEAASHHRCCAVHICRIPEHGGMALK